MPGLTYCMDEIYRDANTIGGPNPLTGQLCRSEQDYSPFFFHNVIFEQSVSKKRGRVKSMNGLFYMALSQMA
jgi:hypothetical protein